MHTDGGGATAGCIRALAIDNGDQWDYKLVVRFMS